MMNCRRRTIALVFGIAALAGGARAAGDDPAIATYRDAEFSFSYRYPASFVFNPSMLAAFERQADAAEKDPELKKRAKCIQTPVIAMKQGRTAAGDIEFGMMILAKLDYGCMGETNSADELGGDAQELAKRMLSSFGQAVTEDATRYKLDGHEAAFVQGSAPAATLGEGKMLHAATVCTMLGQKTMCWLIVDSDHKAMPGPVASPVTFDGHEAVPLVPKDVVQRW